MRVSIPGEYASAVLSQWRSLYQSAIQMVRQQCAVPPSFAVLLGSGLHLEMPVDREIPYADIPSLPAPTVAGHQGVLRICTAPRWRRSVLIWSGRFHWYEGFPAEVVAAPILISAAVGCSSILLTNAAGGLNPHFAVGDLMLLLDHLNFFPPIKPLTALILRRSPYSQQLRQALIQIGLKLAIPLQQGVYVGVSGPNYETPAEVRFYRAIGGDAIGMSTVIEATVAAALGMQVAGCSVITNVLSELPSGGVSHTEVVQASKLASPKLARILTTICDDHLPTFL